MSSSQSHPLEKPHGLLKGTCVIPSACSGIGWEQPRVGGAGRNGLWAKVVVGTEGQKLGCESVMLFQQKAEQRIFMAITKPKCLHPVPQSTTVIKEAVLQKIICVVGPER